MFLTIPTIMTWTRIVAIPLIVGIFYLPETLITLPNKNLVATIMFVLFAATDWLDGYLARKLNQTSSFGKTVGQMVAIPFLLYDGVLFGVIDTRQWGHWLIWVAAVLTVWSMVYYLQKAVPEIRARVK